MTGFRHFRGCVRNTIDPSRDASVAGMPFCKPPRSPAEVAAVPHAVKWPITGEDHPLACPHRRKPPGKVGGIREPGVLAEELQLATPVDHLERLEEASAKQA